MGWGAGAHTPDTDTESSLPTVGVVAVLRELLEEMDEVLSARARGAMGGGLAECTGALDSRPWIERGSNGRIFTACIVARVQKGVGHLWSRWSEAACVSDSPHPRQRWASLEGV